MKTEAMSEDWTLVCAHCGSPIEDSGSRTRCPSCRRAHPLSASPSLAGWDGRRAALQGAIALLPVSIAMYLTVPGLPWVFVAACILAQVGARALCDWALVARKLPPAFYCRVWLEGAQLVFESTTQPGRRLLVLYKPVVRVVSQGKRTMVLRCQATDGRRWPVLITLLP